jgi:hypothetical protein
MMRTRRKTTSYGYVNHIPRYAVMFTGTGYTLNRVVGGTLSQLIGSTEFPTDDAARAALGETIEWRRLNVTVDRHRIVKSFAAHAAWRGRDDVATG